MAEEPLILLVGGADTGRAPIAAALMGRLLGRHSLRARVESAGVLGHDDAPAQPEARDALAALGLDIGEHRARSLDDRLAQEAALLLTLDSGTLRVLQARQPDCRHCFSIAELAGVQRDIPDPFRMQVGAWITYAREIEQLLQLALPRIITLAGIMPAPGQVFASASASATGSAGTSVSTNSQVAHTAPTPQQPDTAALGRLLAALAEFPDLFNWPLTSQRIEREAGQMATGPLGPAFVALLRALLALTAAPPSRGQIALLQQAAARLEDGPTQEDVSWLSTQVASWPTR